MSVSRKPPAKPHKTRIVVLSDSAILGTTLRSGQNPWRSIADWRASGSSADAPIEVRIGTLTYFAREVLLATTPAVAVIIVRARDEAFAPYQACRDQLMLIALIVAAVAVSSAILAPRLVRRAARGAGTDLLSACNSTAG